MFELNRDDLSLSAQVFLDNTGHSIIELLNKVLTQKSDLEQIVKENNVENVSSDLPGLIVQARLSKIITADYRVTEKECKTLLTLNSQNFTFLFGRPA